jgi:HUS1 checkpoint protein
VPIGALNRALRSAARESTAQLRLTKKGPLPLLALTVVRSSWSDGKNVLGVRPEGATQLPRTQHQQQHGNQTTDAAQPQQDGPRERETVITQEIPVRVLHPSSVENLHQPRCPEPDVHIVLPTLIQLKAISERFTKLAMETSRVAASGLGNGTGATTTATTGTGPRLELSANMHGSVKLAIATDALRISSVWTGLINPALDPAQLSQSAQQRQPSERMREMGGEGDERGWAKVRIDGKDWSRVLSVGRLSPKVVAGKCSFRPWYFCFWCCVFADS